MDTLISEKWPDFRLIQRSDGGWIATSEHPALGAAGVTQDEACGELNELVRLVRSLAAMGTPAAMRHA